MKWTLFFKISIVLLFIIPVNELRSQIKCKIDSYSTEDGLSHDNIRDIIKDKEGFMWFATWDGINRFDGRNFITYKATAGDHSDLGNNRIDVIKEDKFGYIWLKAYDDQIYRFDKKTKKFLSISKILGLNKVEFKQIIPAGNGDVWLTTKKNGIYQVKNKDKNKVEIFHFSKDSKANFRILSNKLNFVSVDGNNTLWIGSDKGLDMISKTDHQNYKSKNLVSGSNIKCFLIQEANNVWFGTTDGKIIGYNKRLNNYSKIAVSNKSINSIIKDRTSNLLYITTSAGELITLNSRTFKTESIFKVSNLPIHKIYQDGRGMFWVEPDETGVLMVDLKEKKIRTFLQNIDASNNQLRNSYTIFEDNYNRVWVKLKGGGFGYYNQKTDTFDYFFNKPEDLERKFSNMVSTIYFDPSGIMWMSTNDGGINKIILQRENFQQQFLIPDAKNKLENEIRALYSDKKKRLWMASKAGQLKIYQNNKELKNLFVNFEQNNIGFIYSIIEDTKGNIWLGTKGNGLFKAIPVNFEHSKYRLQQFKTDENNPKSISSDLIYSILEDRKGHIWIGTYSDGINMLEENKGVISFIHDFPNYPLEESSRVRYLTEGYNGEIWVATTNGLITFDPGNYNPNRLKFSRYIKSSTDASSLNSNDVLYIQKDSQNKMWLSTAGGGLNLAELKDKRLRFKNFTKQNGLSSDFILSMVEDNDKNLWLSTENGISRFSLLHHNFRNYDSYDGLFKTKFSEATSLKLANGNLMFGCRNGYLVLDPKRIQTERNTTKMVFTNFEVNNKVSNVNAEESPLKQDINYTNNIELDYLHNTVSIYFTVLDYRSNNKQLYAYRLKGLDDTWHEVKNQKRATFTNLEPGDYEFEVKCLNTELYSNIPQKKIAFLITPPFWRTNLAYVVYFLIAIGLLEFARRIAYSMIRLRNKVVVEQKMTELKLSFFTNISHELRTPLTLIVNPIDEIAKNEKLSPLGNEYIEVARKNTNRMVRFVNQLLDFRKVQSGNEELNVERVELVTFINEIVTLFSHSAQERNIKIKTNFSSDYINASLDRNKMDIILYNLLSNAVKFSPDNSTITLEIKIEKDQLLMINVSDEGSGVDENKLEDIFKLYYETNDGKTKNVGTGIGLALCKEYINLHQGSIKASNNENGGLKVSIEIDLTNEIFEINNKEILINEKLNTSEVIIKQDYLDLNQIEQNNNSEFPVVLIVEDNTELRGFLKSQLQRFYRILEAENGKIGFEVAKEQLPDLILSDIMMPEMDGIELLKTLKNTTETSHIPLILLTAKSAIENQIEGLKYGADHYITKPFHNEVLLAKVENLIKSRKVYFENLQNHIKTISLEPNEIIITTKDEQFLKDIIAVVEANYDDSNFNIDVLIKSLNVSRATFNRKFKSLTNMTAVEYVKDLRVKKGKQFLDAGERDIATIAYKVGFNNAGYFSTCFKETFQVSPSDYLKQKI
jgi:signal transduction histidine kinase/ligand-binding sensor domain-containing protein/DNA-binding response OmpR family regulator